VSCELNRDAKIKLWEEDLAWLMQQPRTLERDHIADVLNWRIREWREQPTHNPTDPTPEAMQAAKRINGSFCKLSNEGTARIIDEAIEPERAAAMAWQCAKFHEAVALLRRWAAYPVGHWGVHGPTVKFLATIAHEAEPKPD
jgi:hypothetical protein